MEAKEERGAPLNRAVCGFCGEEGATIAIKTLGEVFNLCEKCAEYQILTFDAEEVSE
jgi:ribosome-binding protein aMBF1 (putative translation factor)